MNKTIENEMKSAVEKILNSEKIYIVSHVQPDGDNLGSCLSLALAMKKIKKEVFILKVGETPSDFSFLPGIDMIRDYNGVSLIDLLIAVDASDIDRLGKNKGLINSAKTVINIDHHISNTNFGHINVVDSNASATGELIYKLINELKIVIDEDIATCIYTAISTDTGSFMYDNTTAETHEIASNLIKHGADKENININIYQNRSLSRTELFIKSLNSLDMYFDNQVAIIKVTKDMLKETNTTMEDTEGIISFVRDIGPVEVAVLMKETNKEQTKISMRSKRYVDVAKLTSVFNGGGHKKAAGCTINRPILEVDELLLSEIKKVIR